MRLGIDHLGANKFLKELLAAQRPGDCGGIFLRTFGDATATVEAILKSKKWSELVVHLAPFDSTHSYDLKKYLDQVYKDAAVMQRLAVKYPNTLIGLSPFCEHNYKRNVMTPIFDRLRQIAPTCFLVNTIWKGDVIPGTVTELHLANASSRPKIPAGEYIISCDGFGGDGTGDVTDADLTAIMQFYSGARQFRTWKFRLNGKNNHKDTTPIPNRKAWPSVPYLRGLRMQLDGREGPMTWPKTSVYKSFAEDSPGDPKANHALAILPRGTRSAVVKDVRGKQIATMKRFLPDHPLGPRFYADCYAVELGDLAQKSSGGSRRIQINNMPLTDADLRSTPK